MGILDTIRTSVRVRTRDLAERDYLDGSKSLVDLEMRQREIDRGRFLHLPARR